MTGTLTVLGGKTQHIEWDTDTPASVEAARRAYAEAKAKGGMPMDTTTQVAKPIRNGTEGMPGTAPTDVTIVPRFAGGA